MHDVLVRARGIRAALLGSYDFVAWLVGFAVMGVWQRLVGYGTSADAVDAALPGPGGYHPHPVPPRDEAARELVRPRASHSGAGDEELVQVEDLHR